MPGKTRNPQAPGEKLVQSVMRAARDILGGPGQLAAAIEPYLVEMEGAGRSDLTDTVRRWCRGDDGVSAVVMIAAMRAAGVSLDMLLAYEEPENGLAARLDRMQGQLDELDDRFRAVVAPKIVRRRQATI